MSLSPKSSLIPVFPRPVALVAHLALALALTSCGRSLPTAPVKDPASPAKSAPAGSLASQVAVTLAPGVSAADIAARTGAQVLREEAIERTAALLPPAGTAAKDFASELMLTGLVQTAEQNGWIEPAESRQQSFAFDDGLGTMSTFSEQPAALMLGLAEAQRIATGRGVKVAIIDTGADLSHPMLAGAVIGGYDFVDDDTDPSDSGDGLDNDGDGRIDEAMGHGTHVAGIVRLVAPDAQFYILRALDADGRGDLVQVAAAVRWAKQHGAKVINLSLGANRALDALQNALDEAELAGALAFASVGNMGSNKYAEYPAKSSHVACIAAVDVNGAPADFSSYGSMVELSAPGVAIRSAFPGGGFKMWSGTSMSTPFAAGAAALLAEKHPTWTLLETEARLQGSARRFNRALFPRSVNPNEFGAGILDVAAALRPDAGL